LLERFAQRERLAADPAVLDWLASQVNGGIRPLIGALHTLAALSRGARRALELSEVERRWSVLTPPSPAPSVEKIMKQVARFYSVDPNSLHDRRRQAGTLWPLQVAMFLTREQMGLPWARIGAAFGGRDPSTVRHAVNKVADRASSDSALASALRQLRAEVA
jgi:chromosomal replication initiator protein